MISEAITTNKKASEIITPAGQRFSANQTNQICGATLIAPLNLSRTENESPNARPVGFTCKQCVLSHAKAAASTGFIPERRWTMKKLHPNCPPKGAPLGFARSVRHWRTGQRIYPKTAKAFPIFRRKSGNDKRQLTLGV